MPAVVTKFSGCVMVVVIAIGLLIELVTWPFRKLYRVVKGWTDGE